MLLSSHWLLLKIALRDVRIPVVYLIYGEVWFNEIFFYSQVYSELCQTSKMGHFVKIVIGFTKFSILDVRQGFQYASDKSAA